MKTSFDDVLAEIGEVRPSRYTGVRTPLDRRSAECVKIFEEMRRMFGIREKTLAEFVANAVTWYIGVRDIIGTPVPHSNRSVSDVIEMLT